MYRKNKNGAGRVAIGVGIKCKLSLQFMNYRLFSDRKS